MLEAPRAVSEWYVPCNQAQPALSFMKLSSLWNLALLIKALLFTEFSVTDQGGAQYSQSISLGVTCPSDSHVSTPKTWDQRQGTGRARGRSKPSEKLETGEAESLHLSSSERCIPLYRRSVYP